MRRQLYCIVAYSKKKTCLPQSIQQHIIHGESFLRKRPLVMTMYIVFIVEWSRFSF